jgi:hypothetical protein
VTVNELRLYLCSESSEILLVEDTVALPQHLVTLDSQVVVLAQVAHVEQLLVVLLEQAEWKGAYRGAMKG